MRYLSTRGQAPVLTFDDVLLAGLATDGGLYLPEVWPEDQSAEIKAAAPKGYAALAEATFRPFMAGSAAAAGLNDLVARSYASFRHSAVAPLEQIGANLWLMNLYQGPTLAFKDYALQVVGNLFEAVLAERNERITIVGATSGDTGSAAIEACRGRDNIEIFILFPEGRVSEVQRRQMTTVDAPNVHNIAVKGTFDDCQALVKAMFNDAPFRNELNLSAVNSINWARIMGQVVYYQWAACALGGGQQPLSIAVPTGNFGNVFAGDVARRMGAPLSKLIVGSNKNDILARFFETGAMTQDGVSASYSPSMDIQVSSNFERLLFEAADRDGDYVRRQMDRFKQAGSYEVEPAIKKKIDALYCGHRIDDDETLAVIKRIYEETGSLIDPHTAVGVAAAEAKRDPDEPCVVLSTAHPAKFPDAVEKATGVRPGLPDHLADLHDRPEHMTPLANDLDTVEQFIRQAAGQGA